MTDNAELWVVVETEAVGEVIEVEGTRSSPDTGSGFSVPDTLEKIRTVTQRKRVSLDAQALKAQMESMLAIVNDLFSQADTQTDLRLEEVELSVEINAEGQISLVGNGGKLGNTGGIKLKFTRPD
ncbi:MAG: hypothetical protein ACFB12_13645 [Leptolyngbyaceae cyanobacterium]